MASRDRSQSFAFVYTNIAELLKNAKNKENFQENTPITPPADSEVINLNKDIQSAMQPEKKQSVHELKESLDRLQKLHQKLHFMLEELNDVTDRKKK